MNECLMDRIESMWLRRRARVSTTRASWKKYCNEVLPRLSFSLSGRVRQEGSRLKDLLVSR